MKKKAILIALALLCSFAQGVWAYTITIYEASGIGFAYGAAHLSSGMDGVAFNLNTPDTPAYMKFKGWRMNPTTVPTSWEYVEGEVLTNGIIKPDGDVTVYACYEYVYGTEWTWASDYSSATVKITSLEHQDDTGYVVEASRITSSVQEAPAYGTPDEITYTATATMLRTSDGKVFTFTDSKTMWLANLNEDDNTKVLGYFNNVSDKTATVSLTGRTLYKDGSWNTLCLPFDVTISGSVLDGDGVEVKTLESSTFDAGTLTMNFSATSPTTLTAGTPYIIRWTKPDGYDNDPTDFDLANPVFQGVTVGSTPAATETATSDYVNFVGTYSPASIYTADRTNLYLGADNTLYYPTDADFQVNALRGYFQLKNGLTAGEPVSGNNAKQIRAFKLNFGDSDEEATGIMSLTPTLSQGEGAWYTLDGRKLDGKPTQKGIYINNGKKVIIK